jgi:hypothetical protein
MSFLAPAGRALSTAALGLALSSCYATMAAQLPEDAAQNSCWQKEPALRDTMIALVTGALLMGVTAEALTGEGEGEGDFPWGWAGFLAVPTLAFGSSAGFGIAAYGRCKPQVPRGAPPIDYQLGRR